MRIPPTTIAAMATMADISNLLAALVPSACALALTPNEADVAAPVASLAVTYTRCVEVERPVEVLLVGVPLTTVTTTSLAVTTLVDWTAVSSTPSEVIVSGSEVDVLLLFEMAIVPIAPDAPVLVPLAEAEEEEATDDDDELLVLEVEPDVDAAFLPVSLLEVDPEAELERDLTIVEPDDEEGDRGLLVNVTKVEEPDEDDGPSSGAL